VVLERPHGRNGRIGYAFPGRRGPGKPIQFLEFFFGLFIPGIAVGVKLNSQAPVGFLDFILTGAAADAQNFVVVSFSI
jgi:hypothetical protein